MDVFYGDGVSFFVQKKVGQLVTDDDIIIKILWRHKEYQMCFGNQTIGYVMEQAQYKVCKIPYRRDVLPTFLDFTGY